MPRTEEQAQAIDFVKTGQNTKIQAPAGSGKTYTLWEAAKELKDKRGLYVAFNKAIADSAGKKFPAYVNCRTGHSLAFTEVGRKYSTRLGKITGTILAKEMDIGDVSKYPTPPTKGYLILDTLRIYCYSAEDHISPLHVPKIVGPYTPEEITVMEIDIANQAKKVWDKMADINNTFPITHDFYLKLWALSNPKLNKDFILFDEAQDANAVILKVITGQKNSQLIFVGDKYQQIYAWRGAINAMDKIKTEHSAFLTQSFRFGPAIAEMANKILQNYMPPDVRPLSIKGLTDKIGEILRGKPKEDFTPDAILCRTNAGVISNVFQQLALKRKVYIQGGVTQTINLLKGASDLKAGRKTWCPELCLFNNWQEVMEYSNSGIGQDMKAFVSMIETHGIQNLINTLQDTCTTPEESEVILTTAHRAKGLEWETVKLHSDFYAPAPGKRLPQGEINLLYVAATRALSNLDISDCPPCHDDSLYNANASFFDKNHKHNDWDGDSDYDEDEED